MGNRNLQKEFKEQLQPKEFIYSNEHWSKAEELLNKAQPKSGFAKYYNGLTIFLSIIIIALLGITFTLNKKNDTSYQISPQTEVAQPNKPLNNHYNNAVEEEKKELSPVKNEETNTNSSKTEERVIPLQEEINKKESIMANTTIKAVSQKTNTKTEEGFITENTQQKNTTLANNKEVKNNQQNKTAAVVTITEAKNGNTNEAVAETNNATTESTVYNPPIDNNNEDRFPEEVHPPAVAENNEITHDEPTSEVEETETIAAANKEAFEKNLKNEEGKVEDNNILTPTKPVKKGLHQNYFRVGVEIGVAHVNRTLTTDLDDCIEYVNKRNNQEMPLLAYSANFNFGQQINRWQWQLGLGFTNYQEDINYNNQVLKLTGIDSSYWNTQVTVNTKVDSSWAIDSIFVGHWNYDTTVVTTIDSNYVEEWDSISTWQNDSSITSNNGTHSLSYFEIPLFVGYTFGKNRWFFDVQPGVSIGFLTGSKGSRYINKNLSGLNNTATQTEQFRQVIWKAHLRIGVRYSLDKWEFGLYPNYSATLNNILKTDQVFQRYQNFGIMIGAYYKF